MREWTFAGVRILGLPEVHDEWVGRLVCAAGEAEVVNVGVIQGVTAELIDIAWYGPRGDLLYICSLPVECIGAELEMLPL